MNNLSKKIVINNKTMTVIDQEQFARLYNDDLLTNDLCVERGDGYVYPIIDKYKSDGPSAVRDDICTRYTPPKTDEEKSEYSASRIIDFGSKDVSSFKDHIKMIDKLKSEENAGLTIVNTKLTLPINIDDSVELKTIRSAINKKGIDSESYKNKFPSASDYNNDMRILKNPDIHTISFFKAKRILNSFDIEAELILRDKKDIVNPIGEELHIVLTEEE